MPVLLFSVRPLSLATPSSLLYPFLFAVSRHPCVSDLARLCRDELKFFLATAMRFRYMKEPRWVLVFTHQQGTSYGFGCTPGSSCLCGGGIIPFLLSLLTPLGHFIMPSCLKCPVESPTNIL